MDNKCFLNLRQAKFPLTIAKLTLSLSIPISAQAVEVTQVPTQPNLPQTLPPPQDVVPPTFSPLQPQSVPSLSPPENILPTTSPKQSPEVLPEFPIKVTKFEFVGGTVFKDEELLRIIKAAIDNPKYLDEKSRCEQLDQWLKQPPPLKLPRTEKDSIRLTFTQLQKASSAIEQLYICKGYINSGALIPVQELPPEGGTVKIQIVEGSLEDIKIIGTRRLNPNYIRSRLAIATKKPLNENRLRNALGLLLRNPRIKQLTANLSAGTRVGTNLLTVKVDEKDTFDAKINLDNSRSPSVGSFQRSVQLQEDNLSGIGDTFSLFYANTDGSNQVNFNYTLPLTPQNTTLSFTYGYTANNVIEEPFNKLDIISRSNEYQLSLRHPIIETPNKEFVLGLALSHQRTQTFLGLEDIGGYPLSPGADNEGRTRISALRFVQEWTQWSDRSILAFRSQFSFGLNILDATINDVDPDSEFFTWRGQAQWVRELASDTLLVLRGEVQVADRNLLTSEQFGLGGLNSVRGYRQDRLLKDNGAFASIELRWPILRNPEAKSLLQIVPFFDVGTSWNNLESTDPSPSWLASVGLGLRYDMSDRLFARFYWGIPLISVDSNGQTLQEKGLYFSILWNAL